MKKALVLGCGASGLAAAHYLVEQGYTVTVADTRETPALLPRLRSELPEVSFVGGSMAPELAQGMDLLMISPGLSPEHSAAAALIAAARNQNIDIVGEIELFARELARLKAQQNYAPKIVAITGTNGKTTTTTITGLMVAQAGKSVCVAGNIGPNAIAELLRHTKANTLPDVWVLELSSFQLQTTSSLICDSAAFLNLTQDHVDWHGSMQAYGQAKGRIFSAGTQRVVNRDDENTMVWANEHTQSFGDGIPAAPGQWGIVEDDGIAWLAFVPRQNCATKKSKVSLLKDPDELIRLMPLEALRIRGRHNAMNALAALALVTSIGVGLADALKVLEDYCGEPHRVQFVLKTNGIEFIDDSKGTNVGATVAALVGLGGNGQKSSIILGGDSKGQDFAPIAQAIEQYARHIVFIGRDAALIEKALADSAIPRVNAGMDFEKAVELAYEAALPGDAVLLSPACASWDMFRDYAERSARFIAKARQIAQDADKESRE